MAFSESSDFVCFAQPDWNEASTLLRVQTEIEAVCSRREAEKAYDALLYAVGNNHAGTYFPVVLALFPFFEQVLRDGSEWSRFVVLEAMTDWYLSFWPEPGYERFGMPPDGAMKSLKSELLARVENLGELIQVIAVENGADSASAQELLRVLTDEPQR